MTAKIHAERIVKGKMDGTYSELWLSPDKWRREISVLDFKQIEVGGDSNTKWVTRNLDFKPRVAYFSEIAFENFFHPDAQADERIAGSQRSKKNGSALECVDLAAEHRPKRELCFDLSGALVREEYQNLRFEYNALKQFRDKVFPQQIRVYEAGNEVLDLRVNDPDAPADTEPQFFEHATDAVHMDACTRWPVEASEKVPPQYPEEARRMHVQGTVVLYVLVSKEGRIGKLKVIESAGTALDRSASEAVKQWTYLPVHCGAEALPFETEVRVDYTLRPN